MLRKEKTIMMRYLILSCFMSMPLMANDTRCTEAAVICQETLAQCTKLTKENNALKVANETEKYKGRTQAFFVGSLAGWSLLGYMTSKTQQAQLKREPPINQTLWQSTPSLGILWMPALTSTLGCLVFARDWFVSYRLSQQKLKELHEKN